MGRLADRYTSAEIQAALGTATRFLEALVASDERQLERLTTTRLRDLLEGMFTDGDLSDRIYAAWAARQVTHPQDPAEGEPKRAAISVSVTAAERVRVWFAWARTADPAIAANSSIELDRTPAGEWLVARAWIDDQEATEGITIEQPSTPPTSRHLLN